MTVTSGLAARVSHGRTPRRRRGILLPLIVLTQLGIVVGLGILLDTFLVRTVVIPALWSLVGAKVWWPSALG